MNPSDIQTLANEFTASSEWNFIREKDAISPEFIGVRLFDFPLIGYSDAHDKLYTELQQPTAVGPQFMQPEEWLPNAKSVISFFFPFTKEVRQDNRGGNWPSPLWLHGRIEGQEFLFHLAEHATQALAESGIHAAAPAMSKRFHINHPENGGTFGSNWSERHIAFICGLGTFGLSKGLITEKGMAGRFIGLVTDYSFEPTVRAYSGLYEYCIRCGVCAKNCPVGAISLERGKEHWPCSRYQDQIREQFAPRYGCGKCQVGVPCEHSNPSARKPGKQ